MPDWMIMPIAFYIVGAFVMMFWCIQELSYTIGDNPIIEKYGSYRGSTIVTLLVAGLMIFWLPFLLVRYAWGMIKGE